MRAERVVAIERGRERMFRRVRRHAPHFPLGTLSEGIGVPREDRVEGLCAPPVQEPWFVVRGASGECTGASRASKHDWFAAVNKTRRQSRHVALIAHTRIKINVPRTR